MMQRQLHLTRSAQRAQTPFELRPLVRARGARGVARAAEQLGVGRVERLVVLERRIAELRLEQRQARGVPVGQAPTATARLSSITGDGLSLTRAPNSSAICAQSVARPGPGSAAP
jgi:hypothetical protein